MADEVRINGNVFSFASIVAKKDGATWHGFTSIAYGQKRERTKLWGMGKSAAPRGRTAGKYTPDPVVVKAPKGTARAFKADLAQRASDQTSYGNVEFDLVVQFIDSGEQSITVKIGRCVIVGETSSHEEGTDPLSEELTLDVMSIVENGLTLFDSSIRGA